MAVIVTDIVDCGTGDVQRGIELPEPLIPLAALSDLINSERDRRIRGGFKHQGLLYQSELEDRENISNTKDFALQAQALGAPAGDFYWHLLVPDMGYPEDKPFAWITADNTPVPMDAWGPPALYLAAAKFKTSTTMFGFDLKAGLPDLPEASRVAAYVERAAWPE